jgi:hypothetical protein
VIYEAFPPWRRKTAFIYERAPNLSRQPFVKLAGMEDSFPVNELPGRLPSRPTMKTVRTWYRVGLLGGKVRLRVQRIGGRVFTTMGDVVEFNERLNAARSTPAYRPENRREEKERERWNREWLRSRGYKV